MLALGIIYAAGLMAIGLELGLLIGLIAGLAAIVPYMGFVIGIGAALVAGLFQFGGDLYPMLGIVAVFMVGQALEGMVLTPLLVGDRIGLHPVAVIFAILAGGELFGFTGILLALPVAAVIYSGASLNNVYLHKLDKYRFDRYHVPCWYRSTNRWPTPW